MALTSLKRQAPLVSWLGVMAMRTAIVGQGGDPCYTCPPDLIYTFCILSSYIAYDRDYIYRSNDYLLAGKRTYFLSIM